MILQTFGKKDSYKLQFHQIKVKLSWQNELKWRFCKLGKTFLILEKRKQVWILARTILLAVLPQIDMEIAFLLCVSNHSQ